MRFTFARSNRHELAEIVGFATVVCFVPVVLLMSGCGDPVQGRRVPPTLVPQQNTQGSEAAQIDLALRRDANRSTDANSPVRNSLYWNSWPVSPLADHVEGGSPPGLIEEARDSLDDPIMAIWPYGRGYGYSMRLFSVVTSGFVSSIFMEKNGRYVNLSAGAELAGINEVLHEYRFTRKDFDNPCAVSEFFAQVIRLHMGNNAIEPGGSCTYPGNPRHAKDYLQGTEKDENVLRELCRDPKFLFEGNKWKVTFNAFKPGGSVDQWELIGRHEPQANANEILRIEVTTIKPPGTFSFTVRN